MIHQIEEIWRQTRDLPPSTRSAIDSLFSEIEHHNHKNDNLTNSSEQRELDLRYSKPQSNYYEPRWFNNPNGKIQ